MNLTISLFFLAIICTHARTRRGDHALAAKVIKEWSNQTIDAAYDDSPELY